MSKKKSPADRSTKIGRDATGNVIITGDGNVVNIGGAKSASQPDQIPHGQQDRRVPRVFISSTSEDLKPYREAARDAAISAGILPIQMEYFAASGERPPLEACLHKVSEADVVVLIVAHRYGWVPPDQEGDEGKSITWLECERARADDKEVLAFVVDRRHPWDPELKEEYRIAAAISQGQATAKLLAEVKRNVAQLSDFKAWIDEIGVRATFTTPDSLRARVAESLRDWKDRHVPPQAKPAATARPKRRQPIFPPREISAV